jgi:hypothetical protein
MYLFCAAPGAVVTASVAGSVSNQLEVNSIHSGSVTAMCMSRDGNSLITGDSYGVLCISDFNDVHSKQAVKEGIARYTIYITSIYYLLYCYLLYYYLSYYYLSINYSHTIILLSITTIINIHSLIFRPLCTHYYLIHFYLLHSLLIQSILLFTIIRTITLRNSFEFIDEVMIHKSDLDSRKGQILTLMQKVG